MRKIFLLPIALVFIAGATPASTAQNDDFLIVPGDRIGAITRDTSEESLRALYGDDRVVSDLIDLTEGFVCEGSRVLFDNGEFLEITWLDVEAKAAPNAVYVSGASWRTGDGIGIGTSLRELEAINGKPFRLAGFGWDNGGTIMSWGGGRLEGQTRGMWIILVPDGEAYERVGVEAGQVGGDIEFSSGHLVMQKLNPRVIRLVLSLDPASRDCHQFKRPY